MRYDGLDSNYIEKLKFAIIKKIELDFQMMTFL